MTVLRLQMVYTSLPYKYLQVYNQREPEIERSCHHIREPFSKEICQKINKYLDWWYPFDGKIHLQSGPQPPEEHDKTNNSSELMKPH